MDDSSDRVKLIEQQPARRKGERRSRSRQRNGEGEWSNDIQQMATFSDSEGVDRDKNSPQFQETAVFSDALSDAESLPSHRAMVASMKHKEVRIRDTEKKESTPLLIENGSSLTKESNSSEELLTTYSTIGQKDDSKKRSSVIRRW